MGLEGADRPSAGIFFGDSGDKRQKKWCENAGLNHFHAQNNFWKEKSVAEQTNENYMDIEYRGKASKKVLEPRFLPPPPDREVTFTSLGTGN